MLSYRVAIVFIKMPSLRSKTEYENQPNQLGRSGRQATLPGTRRNSIKRVNCPITRARTANTRSASTQINNTAAVMHATVASPTVYDPGRSTRNSKPFCTHFGKNRYSVYPTSFFCIHCVWWEEAVDLNNTRARRDSNMYSCRAGHYDWLVPRPMWTVSAQNRLLSKEEIDKLLRIPVLCIFSHDEHEDSEMIQQFNQEKDADMEASDRDEEIILLSTEQSTVLQVEESSMKRCCVEDKRGVLDSYGNDAVSKVEYNLLAMRCNRLLQKSEALRKQVLYYKSRYDSIVVSNQHREGNRISRDDALESVIAEMIKVEDFYMQVNHKPAASRKSFRRDVARLIWNNEREFCQVVCEELYNQAVTSIRQKIYSPANILKAMDLAGGTLSMEAIEVLRSIEHQGRKWFKCLLPSSAAIKKVSIEVEYFAKRMCPFKHGVLQEGGEFVVWNPEQMISMVLKGFGLQEQAKVRPVSINQAIDSANLSKNLGHTTFGCKVCDMGAYCPTTKRPLYGSADETSIQSRNNCFPFMIIMAKESKKIIQQMKPIIEKLKEMSEREWMGFKPLKLGFNADMSAVWKLLGVGGAAKVHEYPCHCCTIKSSDLTKPNAVHCARWCKNDSHPCYHQPFLSNENLATIEESYNELKATMEERQPAYDELCRLSIIRTNEDPRVPTADTCITDNLSIHFDYDTDAVAHVTKAEYSRSLMLDLLLRNMDVPINLKDRQSALREALIVEYNFKEMKLALERGNKMKVNACVQMLQAVPCILHAENRMGLKIFGMAINHGMKHALKGDLYADESVANKRFDLFFEEITHVMNTEVLGNDDNPGQWDCPRDRNAKVVGEICLDNNRTRKIINIFDTFIDLCIPQEELNDKWKVCIGFYRRAIQTLRKKDDFTDDQIDMFQNDVDEFFRIWVNLCGHEGVTNYIHMMASGHFSEYLIYWRNLYRHSQQGWEAFNSFLKTFFFRRTNRGGAGNRGTGKKSKVLAIARWISRRIIWMCGYDYDFILADNMLFKEGEGIVDDSFADDYDWEDVHWV